MSLHVQTLLIHIIETCKQIHIMMRVKTDSKEIDHDNMPNIKKSPCKNPSLACCYSHCPVKIKHQRNRRNHILLNLDAVQRALDALRRTVSFPPPSLLPILDGLVWRPARDGLTTSSPLSLTGASERSWEASNSCGGSRRGGLDTLDMRPNLLGAFEGA